MKGKRELKSRLKLKLKLAQKIALLVVVMVICSVGVSAVVAGNWYIARMVENLSDNTLNVVQILAKSSAVIDEVGGGVHTGEIQRMVEATQRDLEHIDVIVVADKYGERYGHTKSDRVGNMFSAEDNDRAVLYGETYVSIGPGTLGDSMRAFTPILDKNGDILGFVMAGTLLDSITQARRAIHRMTLLFILGGCAVGICGAAFLARYVKRSLLGYEPEDISRLYLENQGILSTVHEGVIAINAAGEITLMNETAKQYLGNDDADIVGKKISEVFPLSKLPEVLERKEALLNVPHALQSRMVLSNNVPIINKRGVLVGGVCSFRDETEMNRLAEEMTGVKKIVDALRATTHEFKNKLHVILGFVETDQLEQAKRYIGDINDRLQETISVVLNHIQEPTVAALCIGKSQRCQELKIQWELDEDSYFTNELNLDVNALTVIIGNFLDNAMDNLDQCSRGNKQLQLLLNDEGGELVIAVTDNGTGIPEDRDIFAKGVTTKGESRGYGLFLVKEQVDKYGGTIRVDSVSGEGSRFEVRIRRQEI